MKSFLTINHSLDSKFDDQKRLIESPRLARARASRSTIRRRKSRGDIYAFSKGVFTY